MDQGVDRAPINPMSLLRTDLFWVMEQHLRLALSSSYVVNLVWVSLPGGQIFNYLLAK